MIIFKGIKKIGIQSFMIFENEKGSFIDIPVEDKLCTMFSLYFDRLSPSKTVETPKRSP